MSNAILRGREPKLLAMASLGGKSLERRREDNAVEREREREKARVECQQSTQSMLHFL